MTVDMYQTVESKSDQLNSDDLIGRDLTFKIKAIKYLGGDQPIAIYYENDNNKPYKPCKSMRRLMIHVWGANGDEYIGKSMTLFRDDNVRYAGKNVGGIRISHMSNIDKSLTVLLTVTRQNKKPYTINPLIFEEDKKISYEIMKLAEEAANKGVEEYKKFLSSLPKNVKNSLKSEHPRLSKIAKNYAQNNDIDNNFKNSFKEKVDLCSNIDSLKDVQVLLAKSAIGQDENDILDIQKYIDEKKQEM